MRGGKRKGPPPNAFFWIRPCRYLQLFQPLRQSGVLIRNRDKPYINLSFMSARGECINNEGVYVIVYSILQTGMRTNCGLQCDKICIV